MNLKDNHLRVVRGFIAIRKPCGLGVRNLAKFADDFSCNNTLLALDYANLKASILRLENDFMSVEAVESLGSILAG